MRTWPITVGFAAPPPPQETERGILAALAADERVVKDPAPTVEWTAEDHSTAQVVLSIEAEDEVDAVRLALELVTPVLTPHEEAKFDPGEEGPSRVLDHDVESDE